MEHTRSIMVPVTPEQRDKAEKVMERLRICSNKPIDIDCRRCPYDCVYEENAEFGSCMDALMADAANILEEIAGFRKDR